MENSETIQVIVFTLGNEKYGVEISQVREIIKPTKITRIPNAPDFVEGVINLRGQVTTIINLRKRFGLPPKEVDNNTRIIIVEHENSVIGIMVDSISEVKYISSKDIEPLPSIVTARNEAKFLKGICNATNRKREEKKEPKGGNKKKAKEKETIAPRKKQQDTTERTKNKK